MTVTTSAAGGTTASAHMDRYFLSVNGQLQGPFTRSQLEQRPAVQGAWVWQTGQDDWAAWSPAIRDGNPLGAAKPKQAGHATAVGPADEPAKSTAKLLGGVTTAGVLYFLFKLFVAGTLSWSDLTGQGTADTGRPVDAVSATGRPVAAPDAATVPPASPDTSAQGGLARSDLGIASAYVEVRWQTATGASGSCTGTASPVMLTGDILILLTNCHLLDLSNLLATKPDGGLQISQYQIDVTFPSGAVRRVIRFRPKNKGRDLMALDIDARRLRPGIDYVTLPVLPDSVSLQAGDEVVAIGNPGVGDVTFTNTQTFGHVSALRDDTDENKVVTKYVQTDAAINDGNSGGPLMVKVNDRYWWAGINTLIVAREQGYQGLNFAIDARQAVGLKCSEFDAGPKGMASYLTSALSFPAGAATP